MLKEYAVEPAAIAESWQTFRYLIEKFGFEQGRLISQFPSKWPREVIKASGGLSDIDKKRITETLREAKKDKLVKSGRSYNPDIGSWLKNAVNAHEREPFHAIIASKNISDEKFIVISDDVSERHPLMECSREKAIPRDVDSLAEALTGILRFGKRIIFVDPFFDPFNIEQKKIFLRLLKIIVDQNPDSECEIHYRYHEKKPDNTDFERNSATLADGLIPPKASITLYCWEEKSGGSDFHARYLLTEMGGVRIDAGFQPVGSHQTTDVTLMDYHLSQMRLDMFSQESKNYRLIEPVIRISTDGEVARI